MDLLFMNMNSRLAVICIFTLAIVNGQFFKLNEFYDVLPDQAFQRW